MSTLDWIVVILVVVGALNWGLVGLFGLDLVATLFGAMSLLSRIVYVLVGLAGLYKLVMVFKKK
ncbi:DUF378 domain-containing protein [Patescibacteria group bacterium]|nr:DUF378 domain-containing protein [Patescibacteria group bacterium]MBU1705820.1 DUF378 domain-containing protein [Patescibacteria group bacterium]